MCIRDRVGGVGGHAELGDGSDAAVAISVEWAADPTDTGSVYATKAIQLLDDDGTVAFDGTKTGYQANGIDFDFDTTNGTARLWAVASVETASAEATLLINDATHNQAADNTSLVQQHTLSVNDAAHTHDADNTCLLYTSPSPRDRQKSRMPSSA